MGKRTSDFMSLTAIVVGGGIGLGLTSLFLVGSTPIAQVDDISVEVHIVQRADVSSVEARTEHYAVILTGEQDYSYVRTSPLRLRTDLDELERVRADVVREELEGLKALEELEGLEGLQSLRFNILQRNEDEDQRRRRRRRRPREEAPDASGN